jgi:subtilase family serine protease
MELRWALPLPPKLAPGLCRLFAAVDQKGRVSEMNEENNEFGRVIRVVAPR